MDQVSFIATEDSKILEYCEIHFGPKNARQAIKALEACKMESHRDNIHSQSTFVAKFDNLRLTFELVVNDLVKCHNYWPTDTEDIEYGVVTIKNVMTAWANVFPKPSFKGHPISVQMETCRKFIDLNKDAPFDIQVKKLRKMFVFEDNRVKDGKSHYTTAPIVPEDPKQTKAGAAGHDEHHGSSARGSRGGGVRRQQPESSGDGRPPRQPRDGRDVRRRQEAPTKWNKSVPGHKRCVGCGSANNHWGLGFTAKGCPLFGHAAAKARGYIWKSTDDEQPVRISTEEYKKILLAKPSLRENWLKARTQIKDQRAARVAALATKSSDDNASGQTDDQRADSDNESPVNDSDYPSFESSVFSNCQSLVRLSAIESSLAAFGHERQYFGVTRFARNEAFTAKTLMDPGAELNIISPALANRCAIKRQVMDVHIFQGKRKQGTVNELAYCPFELLTYDKHWSSQAEWFAVDDMGYDVLLGRRFCRMQGFTSFDEKLTAFDAFKPTEQPESAISAISAAPPIAALKLNVSRAELQPGEARFKRQLKRVHVTFTTNTMGIFPRSMFDLSSRHSKLKCLQANGDNEVQLEFFIDGYSGVFNEWFTLSDEQHASLPCQFAQHLGTTAIPTKSELQLSDIVCRDSVSSVVTDNRNNSRGDYRGQLHNAPSNAFKHSAAAVANKLGADDISHTIQQRESAPYRFRGKSEAQCEAQQAAADMRYVSFHPITNHKLLRSNIPPLRPQSKDHPNYVANYNILSERAAIIAAYETASTVKLL